MEQTTNHAFTAAVLAGMAGESLTIIAVFIVMFALFEALNGKRGS